ncbi:hypothetical protein WN55_05844 [Dufourea novaeangliae]|uniref:Secreted protein n=1 Tax=Dufourea novaeangliae TaxID=178035 RepID=A0A154P1X4_DUFNO|nr:hypothetical protein WN55_05844 [Dufourea novaeangliae]
MYLFVIFVLSKCMVILLARDIGECQITRSLLSTPISSLHRGYSKGFGFQKLREKHEDEPAQCSDQYSGHVRQRYRK